MYNNSGIIINRVKEDKFKDLIKLDGLSLYGFIDEDPNLQLLDIQGKSLFELEDNSITVKGLETALKKAGII